MNNMPGKNYQETFSKLPASKQKVIVDYSDHNEALLLHVEHEEGVIAKADTKIKKAIGIIKEQKKVKEKSMDIITKIKGKTTEQEDIKLNRHKVSPEHRSVKAIEKWTKYAIKSNNSKLKENLDSMSVIAEDELQLKDGTIVKLGYPDIQADNYTSFERMVKDAQGKDIKAMYFKNYNLGEFKKLIEEMKNKGFRLPGNEKDKDGKVMIKEFKRIFGMIVKEGTPNYTTIIIDILGRAFSGFRTLNGDWFNTSSGEENFWSYSGTSDKNLAHYCVLLHGNESLNFIDGFREYGYGVLFIKDR